MASTTRRGRTETREQEFMGFFPNPQVSMGSSVQFVKKLTAVAVSSILFMRNLFDNTDFADREMGGINVKIIRGGRSNGTGAQRVNKWLEGAFHAIEQKYLRVLIFEIVNPKTTKVLEFYLLRFRYQNDDTSCTVESQNGGKARFTSNLDDTESAVRHLMRNIFILSSLHTPLPPNCTFCMKLQYYDEVTPPDYEPPGFRSCDDGLPEIEGIPYRLGSVPTPFHVVGISSKSASAPDKALIEPKNPPQQSDDSIVPSTPVPSHNGPLKTDKNTHKELRVKCSCGLSDYNDCVMLQCQVCASTQHGSCYKVEDKDAAINHICIQCRSNEEVPADMKMEDCLIRRTLKLGKTHASLSIHKIVQELQVDQATAAQLMRTLLREDVISKKLLPISTTKPKDLYRVNKDKMMKTVIPKYFDKI